MDMQNESLEEFLGRIQWRDSAFQWLKEKCDFNNFELDDCLWELEKNPLLREAALAAFWGVYLANKLPPSINEDQQEKISKILKRGFAGDKGSEDMNSFCFVKLHLAGLLAICLIKPDLPIDEYPSSVNALEIAHEAYRQLKLPSIIDEIIDDVSSWGKKYFSIDLFTFSAELVSGITTAELFLLYAQRRQYEKAFIGLTNAAWSICATMNIDKADEFVRFRPYLPHSGKPLNIQEVADIFEEIKRHAKDIKNWEDIRLSCEGIKYFGYHGLYDWLDDIRDVNGETFGAVEYWGRAITFAEDQMQILSSPVPVLTKNAMERMETQHRLRRDFFPDTWEQMEKEAQEILVDSEIEWMQGRVDNMVKDIRQVLEIELPQIFIFLQAAINQQDPRLMLTRFRDELLRNPIVKSSINGLKISSDEKKWVLDELPSFLRDIIDTRNFFEKELVKYGRKSEEYQQMIAKAECIHRKLLGIGCRGALPRLMKIKTIGKG